MSLRACTVLLLLTGHALADEPAKTGPEEAVPEQARGRGVAFPVLPTLQLSASTNGQAQLQVSLSYVRGLGPRTRLEIAPTFSITSSDATRLFSFENGTVTGPSVWSAGSSFSFILWTPAPADRPDGKGDLADHPIWGAHPTHVVSFGGAATGATYDFFDSDPAMNLTVKSATKIGGTAAFSYTYVRQLWGRGGFTFEAPFVFDSSWTPSYIPLHWCTPVGQVPHASGAGSDPGQSCSDSVLGGPTQTNRYFAALQLGYVDIYTDKNDLNRPKSIWRASVGPAITVVSSGGVNTIQAVLQAPFYLNFSIAKGYQENNFLGIIRLTPSVGALYNGAVWSPQVLLTLDLIADRLLFRRSLQWK